MNVPGALSQTAQATLLLTSYFSTASSEVTKPLTISEWGKFASWLKEKDLSPADLLATDPKSLLNDHVGLQIDTDRIALLLGRGHSLALAIEKWQRAGLWVVTRSDPEYPKRLKERLKTNSPPVLFGCGNKALLNAGGLAVVGSRSAGDADLSFTDQVGYKAAAEGIAIVSGGARGVDETAMLGAMKQGGVVIGVMADSLLKAATSAKWRAGLRDGNVVLISPFHPEAGFVAYNAMARNKYIYCLADTSLVIHSGKKGGTFSGADENLKKSWVPLWVKPTEDTEAANADLVSKGGYWCSSSIQDLLVSDLLATTTIAANQVNEMQVDLFAKVSQPGLFADDEIAVVETVQDASSTECRSDNMALTKQASDLQPVAVGFYKLFIDELKQLARVPVTVDNLVESTGLRKSQLSDWLKVAESEGVVKKLAKPVRYQVL